MFDYLTLPGTFLEELIVAELTWSHFKVCCCIDKKTKSVRFVVEDAEYGIKTLSSEKRFGVAHPFSLELAMFNILRNSVGAENFPFLVFSKYGTYRRFQDETISKVVDVIYHDLMELTSDSVPFVIRYESNSQRMEYELHIYYEKSPTSTMFESILPDFLSVRTDVIPQDPYFDW